MNNSLNDLGSIRLSNEEFRYYCKEAQEGNQLAREKIILSNYRYAESVTRIFLEKFPIYTYLKDDILSVALIGLDKAINGFDLTRNNAFLTYADYLIKSEIINLIKYEKKHLSTKSLDENITENSEESWINTLPDQNINIEKQYEENNQVHLIKNFLNIFSDNDKKIITYYYGLQKVKLTQEEIAEILGITQVAISRKIKRLNNCIKNLLTKCDNRHTLKRQYEYLKLHSKVKEFLHKRSLEELVILGKYNNYHLQVITPNNEREIRLETELKQQLNKNFEIDKESIDFEILNKLEQIFYLIFRNLSEKEQYILLFYYRLVRNGFLTIEDGNVLESELTNVKNKLTQLFAQNLAAQNIYGLNLDDFLLSLPIFQLDFSKNSEEDFFIQEFLRKLPREKRLLLSLVYGFADGKKLEYDQISKILNISSNVIYKNLISIENDINSELAKIKKLNLALNNHKDFIKFANAHFRFKKILSERDSKRLNYIIESLQKMPEQRRQLFVLYFGLKNNTRVMQSELIPMLNLNRKQIENILDDFYKKINRNLNKDDKDLIFESKEEMKSLILNNLNYCDTLNEEDLKVYQIINDISKVYSHFHKILLYYFGFGTIRKLNALEIAKVLNLDHREVKVIINKFKNDILKTLKKELNLQWNQEELEDFILKHGDLNIIFNFRKVLTNYITQNNTNPLLPKILKEELDEKILEEKNKFSKVDIKKVNYLITKKLDSLKELKDRINIQDYFKKNDIHSLLEDYSKKRNQALEEIIKTLKDRDRQLFTLYFLNDEKLSKTELNKRLEYDKSYLTKKINNFEDLIYKTIFKGDMSKKELLKLLVGKCIFELKEDYQKVIIYYYQNSEENKLKQKDLAIKMGITRIKVTRIMLSFEEKFYNILNSLENDKPNNLFSFTGSEIYYQLPIKKYSSSDILTFEIRKIIHSLNKRYQNLLIARNYRNNSEDRRDFTEFYQDFNVSKVSIYKIYKLVLKRINLELAKKDLEFTTLGDLDSYIWNKKVIDPVFFMEEDMTEENIEFSDYQELINTSDNTNLESLESISQKVIALSMGFIKNKKYSIKEIAKFLNISELEVYQIINDYLITQQNTKTMVKNI